MSRLLVLLFVFLTLGAWTAAAYRIEEGAYYVGGGFGANINAVRFDVAPRTTPKAELPLIGQIDYAIDRNFGVFANFIPQFSGDSLAFQLKGGAKYWFSFLDAPYVPYVSLALTNIFMFPMGRVPNHYNIGLSPGTGVNFFVLANFLVGAHVHFNPSIAFADGEKKFEFSVLAFFDVSVKL